MAAVEEAAVTVAAVELLPLHPQVAVTEAAAAVVVRLRRQLAVEAAEAEVPLPLPPQVVEAVAMAVTVEAGVEEPLHLLLLPQVATEVGAEEHQLRHSQMAVTEAAAVAAARLPLPLPLHPQVAAAMAAVAPL